MLNSGAYFLFLFKLLYSLGAGVTYEVGLNLGSPLVKISFLLKLDWFMEGVES